MGALLEPSAHVRFVPFTHQRDGSEVVLGRPETGIFLALPEDAFEIVEMLAAGKTIGQAQSLYAAKYGEVPDIGDLVTALAARGLISFTIDGTSPQDTAGRKLRFHFTSIPLGVAQALFSRPALLLYSLIIALAVCAAASRPQLIPNWRALYFQTNIAPIALALMASGLFTTFLHEMSHLLAARSKGVQCRLSVGHRLWVPVAETDMTGIWALPRRDRFLPLLAGSLFDLLSGSVLFLGLFAEDLNWFELAPLSRQFLAALIFGCLLRILWQFFFFVRTDFYYAYATFFGCKTLMSDTVDFLKNQLATLSRKEPVRDQSHIPLVEMKAIRIYSFFWVVGRALAFFTLFFVTLPLLWSYGLYLGSSIIHYRSLTYSRLVDSILIASIQAGFTILGLGLWIRTLRRARRSV